MIDLPLSYNVKLQCMFSLPLLAEQQIKEMEMAQ